MFDNLLSFYHNHLGTVKPQFTTSSSNTTGSNLEHNLAKNLLIRLIPS